ncbi:MAG: indole-3-glycerol phosphate synthase TrpC [Desulfobacteraceae bacterium]|nr:indole-3-glycerol phosphate synthase TrpC [Desulfobacteraceae bacterium]
MAPNILDRIVTHKNVEIRETRQKTPLSELKSAARSRNDRRSFCTALQQHPGSVRIIGEIKRASPSKGDICKDLDPAALARACERGEAAALSVLTDSAFFRGSMEDLITSRNACTLPVLRKDFIVSEYQVYEAAALGADAVLLIVRILSEHQLAELMALCAETGIDALVEVYTRSELEIAIRSGAFLIGINNRNLASFDTDIQNAADMAASLEPGRIAVAASGIASRKDIELNLSAGISRFLIGESLVRSNDPEAFLKHLIHG